MVNKNKILSSDFMKQKYKKGGKKGKGFPCFLFTKKGALGVCFKVTLG